MSKLSPERLAEIAAREAAATAGPWETADCYDGARSIVTMRRTNNAPGPMSVLCAPGNQAWNHPPNANFIAHARTDVPKLLAHIATVEAELTTAREEAQRLAAALYGLYADCVSAGSDIPSNYELQAPKADVWLRAEKTLAGSRTALDNALAEARKDGAVEALEAVPLGLGYDLANWMVKRLAELRGQP